MKLNLKKLLLYLAIFLIVLIVIMLWRDLHLDLTKDIPNKTAQPELTVKGISFEREIGDKLWKVSSPQTNKQGQLISATDIDALVTSENEQTKINAKSGSYHLENQIFHFEDAKLLSKQKSNEYNIVTKDLSFEAKRKAWKLTGNVAAESKEIAIKTNSAVFLENEKTCEMPSGGKITWKEKK